MNKLKKVLSVVIIFCLLAISSQTKTYPYIPLKGLFEVLKVDDIGFGHALLHSKWIENMYHYGEGKPPRDTTKWEPVLKNDPVANMIKTFWFCRDENNQLLPTKTGILSVLTPKVFGLLINALYTKNYNPVLKEWVKLYAAHIIEAQETLKTLKIKQKERTVLYQKMQKLIGKVKTANKKYEKAVEVDKHKFEQKKLSLERELLKVKRTYELKADHKKKIKELRWYLKLIQQYLDIDKLDMGDPEALEAIKHKVSQMFNLMEKAVTLCEAGTVYMPRTAYAIVWALFFHKLEEQVSLQDKITAINDCLSAIGKEFKNEEFQNDVALREFYTQKDFDQFFANVKRAQSKEKLFDALSVQYAIETHYDLGMHYVISSTIVGKFSPKISQGNYGYEYGPGKMSHKRPDCHETATLDLISVLWYNPAKKCFDDALFSEHVIKNGEGLRRLREALKYLYLADIKKISVKEYSYRHFTSIAKLKSLGKITVQEVEKLDISQVPVDYITRSEIKQEFMNIVSGISGVIYCSEVSDKGNVFELDSDVRNLIQIFNYFYGIEVETVVQLGDMCKGISTGDREVHFEKQNDQNAPNKISISVTDNKNSTCYGMTLNIDGGHTSLIIPQREKNSSCSFIKWFEGRILKNITSEGQKVERMSKYASMFTLLASSALLSRENIDWWLPISNLLYYTLTMRDPEVKLKIIKDILVRRPQYYESCKELLNNLLEKFPMNDQYLKYQLAKIIIESGIYKKEAVFEDIIKNKILAERKFFYNGYCSHAGGVRALGLLEVALKHNDIDIAHAIIDNTYFDIHACKVDKVLKVSLKKLACKNVLLKIVTHKTFTDWGKALKKTVEEGCEGIAKAIVDHPNFEAKEYAVRETFVLALKKGYKYVALKILEAPGYDANLWDHAEALVLSLKEGYLLRQAQDDRGAEEYLMVVSKILKNFKEWGRALKYAFEKGYRDVASEIVKLPGFDVTTACIIEALKLALREGYKQVALEIVTDPQFNASGYGLDDVFALALKNEEYKEVAQAIVKNPAFDCCSMGKCLDLAVKMDYRDIVSDILNGKKFDPKRDWDIDKPLVFLLEHAFENPEDTWYQEIADKIMNCPKIIVWGKVLKTMLENGNTQIAKKIVDHPKCRLDRHGSGGFLVLALSKKQEIYKYIASKIANRRSFNCWGEAITYALEKGYKETALEIIKLRRFDPSAEPYRMAEALEIALRNKYKEVIFQIVEHPKFEANFETVLSFFCSVVVKGYQEIAAMLVNNAAFKISDELVLQLFAFALRKGCNQVARAIKEKYRWRFYGSEQGFSQIENIFKGLEDKDRYNTALNIVQGENFKACKSWVCEVVRYAKELLDKQQERVQEVQEIIDLIERKQSEQGDRH